jgi:hypothetical protein
MAKFRKKPVVIEAVQFTRDMVMRREPLPAGVERLSLSMNPGNDALYSHRHVIKTLEGAMNVEIGDWIITGVKGEKYPCKPDIFAETYDLVSD